MEMLDFWCPKNGLEFQNCILIKIPKVCCGTKIIIALNYSGTDKSATCFGYSCSKHMNSYQNIWEEYNSNWKFIVNDSSIINTPSSYGHICSCGLFNEYAEANQSDGSYKCFNCR